MFLQLCHIIHSSLSKADNLWASDNGQKKKKIKVEEESISVIPVADTNSESGAEASDVEDYFEEEE